MLQAVWLKHDHDLQGFAVLVRYVGHEKLPDPEELSLRGTILGCEAGLEAGQKSRARRSLCRISLGYSQSSSPLVTLGEA